MPDWENDPLRQQLHHENRAAAARKQGDRLGANYHSLCAKFAANRGRRMLARAITAPAKPPLAASSGKKQK